jgi:hypothetical protein
MGRPALVHFLYPSFRVFSRAQFTITDTLTGAFSRHEALQASRLDGVVAE